jgi:vancomycin permeability regulator SanA
MGIVRKLFYFLFSIFLIICGLTLRANFLISDYEKYIFNSIDELPNKSTVLILGGGVKQNGEMSDALGDRVKTGIDVYKARKVEKILLTGDNGTIRYNELRPMQEAVYDENIFREDVFSDYAGFRTLDSCVRAKKIFGVTTTIISTQEFHLPRAIFLCRMQGIEAYGIIADRREYRDERYWSIREFFAKFKAWVDVKIINKQPKFLGRQELIFK